MQEKLNTRLDSWKEIAEYLGRNTRTVARWEQEKELPVRRVPGGQRHAIFAYTSELDAWLRGEAQRGPAEAEPVTDKSQLVTIKSEPANDRSLPEGKVPREVFGSGDSQLAKESPLLQSEAVIPHQRKPIRTPRLWSITALTATVMLIGTLLYLAGDRPMLVSRISADTCENNWLGFPTRMEKSQPGMKESKSCGPVRFHTAEIRRRRICSRA